jgi:hypothetical protein
VNEAAVIDDAMIGMLLLVEISALKLPGFEVDYKFQGSGSPGCTVPDRDQDSSDCLARIGINIMTVSSSAVCREVPVIRNMLFGDVAPDCLIVSSPGSVFLIVNSHRWSPRIGTGQSEPVKIQA